MSDDKSLPETSEDTEENARQTSSSVIGEINEILQEIPEEDRNKFKSLLLSSSFFSVGPRSHPLAAKITEDHITQIISNADSQDKRDRSERTEQRRVNLLILVVALVFVGFLVIFLKDQKDLLVTVITAILTFAAGFGIGKVYKKE